MERGLALNIRLTIFALLVLLAASAAADPIEVGYTSEPGLIEGGGLDECSGTLVYNHWGPTNSMGYGFYYSVSTPTHSSTWGAVKRSPPPSRPAAGPA